MFLKYLIPTFFLLCSYGFSNAQLIQQQMPKSFDYSIDINQDEIIKLSPRKEKLQQVEKQATAMQFAYLIETNISPTNSGNWHTIPGGKIWKAIIESDSAFSLNFTLEPFVLPLGAELYFYSADSNFVIGAITAANNRDFKKMAIQAIPGDKVIVEYFLPEGIDFQNDFVITKVGHDFKNAFGLNEAGPCEVNINCPEGEDWQIEKRAVARILIANSFYCTGALINNTNQDGRAFFLTAAHCIHTFGDAENSVFYFNYESADCEGNLLPLRQTISGSQLIATGKNENLDFSLLELTETPPIEYEPYYAGWNRTPSAPVNVVSIHHPDGDIKKISKDYDQTIEGDFGYGYDAFSHWQIQRWDVGTTEGGSSGSPLFNPEHLIVGDLTGGEADCNNPINDYYSRFDRAWNDYPEPLYQLKVWLDPLSSDITKLEGYDPYKILLNYDIAAYSLKNIDKVSCKDTIMPQLLIKNRGLETITEFEYDIFIDNRLFLSKKHYSNIISGAQEAINLGNINADFGLHQIKVVVKMPNGLADENNLNDTINTDFELLDGISLLLELKTDDYAEETSWQIFNAQNEIIFESYPYADTLRYSHDICLDYGCYNFVISDDGGDGICCAFGNGYYSLYNVSDTLSIVSGAQFSSNESTGFCLYPADVQKDQDFPYRLFPNPDFGGYTGIEVFHYEPYSIYVYDARGKLMHSRIDIYGNQTLETATWKSGVYIVHLSKGEEMVVLKLIIL